MVLDPSETTRKQLLLFLLTCCFQLWCCGDGDAGTEDHYDTLPALVVVVVVVAADDVDNTGGN